MSDETQSERRVVGRWLATPDDPFYVTPPTPAEQAQVDEGVALLTAAADRLERLAAEGVPTPWELRGTSTVYMNGWSAYDVRQAGRPGIKLTVTAFPADAERMVALVNAAPDLVAWLRDAAREAAEVGPNPWAVALARKIVGEER